METYRFIYTDNDGEAFVGEEFESAEHPDELTTREAEDMFASSDTLFEITLYQAINTQVREAITN